MTKCRADFLRNGQMVIDDQAMPALFVMGRFPRHEQNFFGAWNFCAQLDEVGAAIA